MSAAPLVSVVTPCHDAEPFVAETIACVLAQTHPAVEHVIVDDGSTDGSWGIVERFATERPDRVRALRLSPAHGAPHARNRGAELARGDFLLFLDADDVMAPDTLAALVGAVRDVPEGIGVCAWKRLEWRDGAWAEAPAEVPFPPRDPDWLRGWLNGPGWVPTCSVLWRRETYARTGGWDEELALNQDGDLALRALASGARLVPAAGGMAFYRAAPPHRPSLTRSAVTERKVRSHVRIAEKVQGILEARGMLERYRVPLGVAYQKAALLGFREGHVALAREALRRGLALSGPRPVSESAPARVLERVLGMERKERLMRSLARLGVMTRGRRRVASVARAQGGGGAP